MNFQAHLVKMNSSHEINMALIGLILFFLSIFVLAFHLPDWIGLLTAIIGILMVLIGSF